MGHVVRRLRALQLVARGCEFRVGFVDGRGRPREIVLHFGDLECREQLSFAGPGRRYPP